MYEGVRDLSVVMSSLSFAHVGPRHHTQVVRHDGELFNTVCII